MIPRFLQNIFGSSASRDSSPLEPGTRGSIGVIAGNGPFPLRFIKEAQANGYTVQAVCHEGETDSAIDQIVDRAEWIRVGELGRMISVFRTAGVSQVAMAGGINRVNHFGDVKLDARGAALMLKLRSTKDDVIMRGIASEIEKEGIEVVPCTIFLKECLAREGVLTNAAPSDSEREDIRVGIDALRSMSAQDIGQLVVVRDGVIVAVEAVEGTDACIRRGGELGGKGTVVVKFAKPTQDMRFDVPTVGVATVNVLKEAGCRVLAVEAGRTLLMEEKEMIVAAEKAGITIIGCPSLVGEEQEAVEVALP